MHLDRKPSITTVGEQVGGGEAGEAAGDAGGGGGDGSVCLGRKKSVEDD